MARHQPKVSIVGAGLAGALLANYLAQAGFEVELFEFRGDPREGAMSSGRSINLAISERGIQALRGVGLADEVLKAATPMRGRMIHDSHGHLTFQPYDKDPARCINSVSRGGLNRTLIDALSRQKSVAMRFNCRCVDIDLDAPQARLIDTTSNETVETSGDLVIGADGAFSTVRRVMQRLERFNYAQAWLDHGYKELCIPPADAGGFRIERNALHIWPRRSFMMIALPNMDGSFTCTCFWPMEGANSFAALRTPDEIRRYFESVFPDAVPHMPTLIEDYQRNPASALVTIRCRPWSYRDKVALIGDAAHAIVPFFGQGMNAAFEDCAALADSLRRHEDVGTALVEYQERRKSNCDAIADLALANFIEMRDHTGSRAFLMRKKIERALHRWLPGWYTPLYTMVSFTTIPYAEVVRRAKRQDRVVLSVFVVVAIVLLSLVAWIASRWR